MANRMDAPGARPWLEQPNGAPVEPSVQVAT